jgi:hypothetical protein
MKKRLSSSYFWISRVSIFVFIKNRQLEEKSFQIFGYYQQEQTASHRQITEKKRIAVDTFCQSPDRNLRNLLG